MIKNIFIILFFILTQNEVIPQYGYWLFLKGMQIILFTLPMINEL